MSCYIHDAFLARQSRPAPTLAWQQKFAEGVAPERVARVRIGRESTLARYSVLSAADLLSRAMAFFATLLIVRAYHDVGLGQIAVSTSIVAYALIASTCGLDVFAVRSVAQSPARVREMVGTVVTTRFALSAFAYAALVIASELLPQLRDIRMLVLLFGLTLFSGAVSLSWVPQALHKTGALAIATLATQAAYLSGVVLLMHWHGPLWGIPIAQVSAECCATIGLLLWLTRSVGAPRFPSAAFPWVATVRQSAPIGGAALLRTVSFGSDLVLLRLLFVSEASIGWYTGAWRIFGLMMGMTALYFVILFPRLSARASGSPRALRDEVMKSGSVATAVAFGAAVVVAIAAPLIMRMLFGAPFAGGATSLRLLAATIVVYVAGCHFRNVLVATGRQHVDLWAGAVIAALHIGVKLALIPHFGIDGAAMGMLIGESCGLVLAWWLCRSPLSDRSPDSNA